MADDPSKQRRPSPVVRLFTSVTSRLRARSPRKTKESKTHVSCSNSNGTSVKESPFRRTLNNISFKRKNRIDKDPSLEFVQSSTQHQESKTATEEPKWLASSPRPALSETDLRHVTIRRGTEIPMTPLAGASQFLSEDNLVGAQCGTPLENRVPSYLKISLNLNGYRSPRPIVENTPLRPIGKSLIERRLAELRDPKYSSSDKKTSNLENSPMGASCSSPSVKNLISQFDRWKLCNEELHEGDHKENIKPHTIVAQPCLSKLEVSEICEPIPSTSNEPSESSSASFDTTPPVTSSSSSARSGTEFKEILNSTRKALEERSKLAESDLENFQSMPEPAADSIRMATGKANLLNRKKLPKFDELVRANLYPETADKVTTTEDLEGYWALVEMELTDINNCFAEVEKWRSQNYENFPESTSSESSARSETNNNEVKKPRVPSKPVINSKDISEKQKAAAEKRKKAIAEARARAKQRKAEEDTSSPNMLVI